MSEEYNIPSIDGHRGGALSLSGLTTMEPQEKSARIIAITNDMVASIVFIAKQAEAGNLTASQIAPIYNFIDCMLGVERNQKKGLIKELEQQDDRMALMERQHLSDIEQLMECAKGAISHMKKKVHILEEKLKRVEPPNAMQLDMGD
ncbi:hypothetical protein FQN57_001651 [Myotisia sp. PD_48]|nr:hypothetical protein FQN57_001651 [Myotisia sp. PD_48]